VCRLCVVKPPLELFEHAFAAERNSREVATRGCDESDPGQLRLGWRRLGER